MSDFWWTGASAVASSGALFVAAMAYSAQAEERRGRQAVRVILRVEETAEGTNTEFRIRNHSDLPIFKIVIPAVRSAWSDNPEIVLDMGPKSAMKPHGEMVYHVPSERLRDVPKRLYYLKFSDAAGQEWVRLPSGELSATSTIITRALRRLKRALAGPRGRDRDGHDPGGRT